tara:strand:- start:3439 stop:3825 length:387 start_codon:yes stop_codon:yes gene_type:complete
LNYFAALIFYFLFSLYAYGNEEECQGAKLRVINKITAEKIFYDIPLSQTLELDNSRIKIYRCLKVERNGKDDEIALISHQLNSQKGNKSFLGWIFKSSQYLNSPINAVYDIKLEQCLLEDPIFLKKII